MFSFGAVRPNPYDAGAPGVTMVYRGHDEALARSHPHPHPNAGTATTESVPLPMAMGDGVNAPGPAIPESLSPMKHMRLRTEPDQNGRPSTPFNESQGEYTDLVLIVHGIGQGVCVLFPDDKRSSVSHCFLNLS